MLKKCISNSVGITRLINWVQDVISSSLLTHPFWICQFLQLFLVSWLICMSRSRSPPNAAQVLTLFLASVTSPILALVAAVKHLRSLWS